MKDHSTPAIEIRNLSFSYPGRQTPALDSVSLTIHQGDFVVLCGPSGCGKTTLLRQLKPALTPHGDRTGDILADGHPLHELSAAEQASRIGFVFQNPENSIVTDKVWHELAFGLESLGYNTPTIRLRVAEMAGFFGIQTWFYHDVADLSGGQKQLLALASIMVLQPSLLILDEPTAQLDPIAAADFLSTVTKINRELGVTVLLTEHRLQDAFPSATRAIVMDRGRILCDAAPVEAAAILRHTRHGMFAAMPVPMRVWSAVPNDHECPLTVRDGRRWVSQMVLGKELSEPPEASAPTVTHAKIDGTVHPPTASEPRRPETPAIEWKEAWFKYGREFPDVIKGLSFRAYAGELTAILGGNGTGKTTALSLAAGLREPYRGKILLMGKERKDVPESLLYQKFLGVLPQNPTALFVRKTVGADLEEVLGGLSRGERAARVRNIAALCRISELLEVHPYDLSGGEQQRAALAKVLLLQPRILLLDEPTKGLDGDFKVVFAGILRKLTRAGVAVVMVSHDIEFCAEYADRCALFFDGNVVAENAPRAFFCGNSFYTSAANRMAREVFPDAVTAGDVIAALGGEPEGSSDDDGAGADESGKLPEGEYRLDEGAPGQSTGRVNRRLGARRWGMLSVALLGFVITSIYAGRYWDGFSKFLSGGEEAVQVAENLTDAFAYAGMILAFAVQAILVVAAFSWRRGEPQWSAQVPLGSRGLSKRTIVATTLILLAIPLTLFVGVYYLDNRRFYFVALLIVVQTMIPFALVFESRKPQARELVILAVLCAVGVAGRSAFFMLPQFKPVVALTIISGVAFGGEAGFLVGAMTGFLSNMFFGQGPWTPWQMFAFGIIGFLAGVLFRKGVLLRTRAALCVYGSLATFVIYGGIMNPAMVLMTQEQPSWSLLWAAYLQGIPMDLIHATATAFFLFVAARPMLEKLDRIKQKYGLISTTNIEEKSAIL